MSAAVRRLFDDLVDLVFPRRCAACGVAGAWLCPSCRSQLVPIVRSCPRCGAAISSERGRCPECHGRELAFASARAAFRYEGPARRLVTNCKFRPLRSLVAEMAELAAPAFSRYCAELAGGDGPPDADRLAVTWVPVHRGRRLERGFDQAELLAKELARAQRLPAVATLRRVAASRRQSSLDAEQRATNVRDAFAMARVAPVAAGKLKNVVIVDDVYTTGETLHWCSVQLRSAGLVPHAFVFARAARRCRSQASLNPGQRS